MHICEESKFLLRMGGLLSAAMNLFAAAILRLGGDPAFGMYCSRVSRGAQEVAPGLFLVCFIGAIAFDLARRDGR